jgi:PGF-CTERM protein
LTEADFVESGGTYTATYDGNSDGDYTATLETAEDAAGNDGAAGQSDTTTVDTTAPSISSFNASNPDGQNVSVSFDSDETVTNISVNLSGPQNATLTEADFTESSGTYTATYEGDSDGNYTATLETAEDADGNDGATGQSDGTTVDTTAPAVTIEEPTDGESYDASEVSLDVAADEPVANWTYSLDGGSSESFTPNITLSNLAEGRHNVTVYAEDTAGNVRLKVVTFIVDTTAPTIPTDSFAVTNPEDQNVSVRIDSDEPLEDIDVDITGSENATLTEADFTEDNGTYTATYEGDSDGNYTAVLEIAEDAAGNDGANRQSNSTTVDTFSFDDDPSDRGFADGVDSDSDGEGTVVNAESVSPGASETDRTPEAYVNVSNPEPGQTLLINETGAVVLESGTSVDGNVPENETALADRDANPVDNILPEQLLIDTNTSDDFELSVRAYEDDLTPSRTLMSVKPESARADRPEDAEAIRSAAGSFESETDTVAAGYVSINTTLASEEVDGATFQFSVRREYLEALGVAPEEVTLYRQVDDDGEWEANETTYLGTVGEYYRYETEIPEVTTLALGTGVPTTEVTDASLEETTIETGETAVVTATVANRGRTATERTVRLTRDGDTVDTATVELEGNETTTVTLAYTPDSTGEYNLSVESTDLETLTVETEAGPDETEGTGTDGDGPGFGVGVALAALCGAGYVLRRRDGPV